jgi:hypothetical protein
MDDDGGRLSALLLSLAGAGVITAIGLLLLMPLSLRGGEPDLVAGWLTALGLGVFAGFVALLVFRFEEPVAAINKDDEYPTRGEVKKMIARGLKAWTRKRKK